MQYLVDGHNLIGQMPGFSLADADDEAKLVMVLRRFATADRKRLLTVVFDRGVYGHPLKLDGYGITCFFARSPQDADTQLIQRIQALQKPGEWRVVTSDRVVARAAIERGVRVISSTDFARLLTEAPTKQKDTGEKPHDVRLSPNEIDEWLRLFGEEPPPRPAPAKAAPAVPEAEQGQKNAAQSARRRAAKKRTRKK